MTERFYRELRRLVGEPAQYRYLLAVSGGADSSVMAHLFHQAGLAFALAHCNFHLRGAESDRDMRQVRAQAETLSAELFVTEFDTLALQKESGISVEMMARKLRYDWFAEIGGAFDFIVTAHHANDALETTLLNLCRGTGLKGAASIPERNGNIIRPLLSFSAEEIRAYAQAHHIDFVVDSTNTDESIRRNRIRQSVVPILEELNPNLANTFSHNRKILQAQLSFYQHAMNRVKKDLLTEKEGQFVINRTLLEKNPDKNVILYEILSDFGFPSSVIDELQEEKPSGRQFFAKEYQLLVDREKYIIQKKTVDNQDDIIIETIEDLKKFFAVELLDDPSEIVFTKDNNVLFVPAEKLVFPLVLRHWRAGDTFFPLGARGRQKLSNFFIDHKVDRFTKQKIRLLCSAEEIVWIVGHRSSELFKVEKNKQVKCYKITNYEYIRK